MAGRDRGTIPQCLTHKTRHQLPRHHQFLSLRWAARLPWGISKPYVTKDCFCCKLHGRNIQEPFESCKSLLLILIWRDASWPGQSYEIGWGRKKPCLAPAMGATRAAPPSTSQQARVPLNTQTRASLPHITATTPSNTSPCLIVS